MLPNTATMARKTKDPNPVEKFYLAVHQENIFILKNQQAKKLNPAAMRDFSFAQPLNPISYSSTY